jgi:hypothetical protein
MMPLLELRSAIESEARHIALGFKSRYADRLKDGYRA